MHLITKEYGTRLKVQGLTQRVSTAQGQNQSRDRGREPPLLKGRAQISACVIYTCSSQMNGKPEIRVSIEVLLTKSDAL